MVKSGTAAGKIWKQKRRKQDSKGKMLMKEAAIRKTLDGKKKKKIKMKMEMSNESNSWKS